LLERVDTVLPHRPALQTRGRSFETSIAMLQRLRAPAAAIGAGVLSAVYFGWLFAGWPGALLALAVLTAVLVRPRQLSIWRSRDALGSTDEHASGCAMSRMTGEAGLGYAAIGRDGALIAANELFAQLAGAHPPGGAFADLFAAHDRPLIAATIAELRDGGKLRDLRIEPVGRAGGPILVTLGYTPRSGRLFALTKDDGLQLRLEAQMRQATKMQAVGQLAGGLAHDFNNILTAIIGHCDLMLMRHGPGSIDHHDADHIRQNANRAANLVRQLLAFSRQQTLSTRVIQIGEVLADLAHLLGRLIGENVRLVLNQANALPPMRVDPGQIEQVLVNLAVNARDAMPDGGVLTISTYALDSAAVAALGHKMMPVADYVGISVSDSGSGIPDNVISKVFEPFFTTKEVGKGTGLGLAMAYGIIKQSGGFIFVESAAGRGTRFDIFLPAATGVIDPPLARAAALPLEGWGQGTILLVEDEAMVREVAARALSRSGYEVLTACSGEEALAIIADRPGIDLLISDVVMHGMDGPTLVVRARAAQPGLRALLISGYAEEQVRSRIDDPATPLLRKPFSVKELSAAVRSRLAS